MSSSTATAPGFWDALRGAGTRRDLRELLDRPDVPLHELAGNLAHLRLMNRWFLWSAAVAGNVQAVMRGRGLRAATLLDVATGSADIPREVVRRAAQRGLHVRVVASDISASVLAGARAHGRGDSRIQLVQHDGAMLPFADGSVDIATCCLAAHHFDPPALARLLAEMWRVARHAVIVSDVARSRPGYVGARLMTLVLRHPLTSHDAPVSVLRAYTPAEMHEIAASVGLARLRVRTHFPARMTLVAAKGAGT